MVTISVGLDNHKHIQTQYSALLVAIGCFVTLFVVKRSICHLLLENPAGRALLIGAFCMFPPTQRPYRMYPLLLLISPN